ncbi:MAG TPA: nucleotidyltransferase [Sporosarcina sp.]|nr:nucleotidyltransferase [Sporosarcina sp.]
MNNLKATGIIVEYNPFHNGHALHAKQAKEQTNSDVVIAVMSGHFLQRGEPAFTNKWERTKMALQNGVDLVFELPYAFATGHAPKFAKGAIQLLDGLLCDSFCFGSEQGQIKPFENSMDLLTTYHAAYEQKIKESMERGMSYPHALAIAYTHIQQLEANRRPVVDLTKPNNILGFHYMQAAKAIQTSMRAETIQRVGAQYHDQSFSSSTIASATAIRQQFFKSQTTKEVASFMPSSVLDRLTQQLNEQIPFANWERFYPLLRSIILRDGPQQLKEIADITEGIENRIYEAALQHAHFEPFMHMIKSKRYTWTRLQRMLVHILTRYTYMMREQIQTPTYLRLLGMTKNGRHYLRQYKQAFHYPIISKASASNDPSLQVDITASNMYYLGLGQQHLINDDYKRTPIMME